MTTAVLILGCHVDSSLQMPDGTTLSWHDLVIGRIGPGSLNGRATYGVGLAFREQADVVLFSTGASRKNGLSEAAYTYQAVLQEAEKISAVIGISSDNFRRWLMDVARLDETSQTTREELAGNLPWCVEQGLTRVILVTSGFHAPRALSVANGVKKELGLGNLDILISSPPDASPAPVIFEPSSRPDRPSIDWHGLLGSIFDLAPEDQASAYEEISRILAYKTS